MRVYLAGTITADPATHAWRTETVIQLRARWHVPLNPMRGKDPSKVSKDGLKSDISPLLFVERDLADIRSADVMLVYTLGIEKLERQSIGTWAEFGVAIERRIPLVFVATHPQVVNYPFVVKYAAAVVPTLDEALKVIDWLSGPA